MSSKETSPKLTLVGLPATRLDFGDLIPFDGEILAHQKEEKQVNTHGFYDPPTHHKRRFPFLEKAGRLIIEALSNPFDFAIGHIFWHKDKHNKDGSYRKVRSERRESMTLKVGRFIMHHVNLGTMMLGFPVKDGFHYYDYEAIARAIGISYSQLQRTMALFIKEGYIEVEQVRKRRIDGSYRIIATAIKINPRIFIDLGIDQKIVMFHVERAKTAYEKKKSKKIEEKGIEHKLFSPVRKFSKVAKQAMQDIMQMLRRKIVINTS